VKRVINLYLGGIVATVVIVILGVIIALPPLLQPVPKTTALLTFNVVNGANMPDWCNDVSRLLKKDRINAAFFISGELAEQYPDCVRSFDPRLVDIGSSTYHHTDLTSQVDYTQLLEEVKSGKQSVDSIASVDSKSFRAPYGKTDDNIYSFLGRSGIVADFSYQDRYHKFHEGQFVRYDADVYDATTRSDFGAFLAARHTDHRPIQINFDNSVSVSEISSIIDQLQSNGIILVSASTLTGLDLTVTGGQ